MKAISTYIQLGSVTLQMCERFSVQSSWDNFTNTATIVVPNVIFKSKTNNTGIGLDALLQRGDPVEVRAGYNKAPDQLEVLFNGYISDIKTGTLIEIKAQDGMYALKQKNIPSKLFKKVTLKELIDYITEGISIETNLIDPNVILGDWVIENNSVINPVQVLDKLKSTYGFVSYIKDGVLNIGIPYDATGKTHYILKEMHFAAPDNLISESNDTQRVLKGVLLNPDNTKAVRYATKMDEKIVVSEAEIKGEVRTLMYYNITAKDMEGILKTVYQKTNFTGLKGDFTIFGEPVVRFNDYVQLRDLHDPERDGTYKVRSVIYEMTASGGLKQNCTIDFGISEVNKN